MKLPDGFVQKLAGKTVEEQMACYRITESTILAQTAYGEITDEQVRKQHGFFAAGAARSVK